jgi:CRISPR-associated protein Csm4
LHPYKKTVLLYDEGAVFTLENKRPHIGMLLSGMHGADKRICQSGFAPLIPIE